MSEVWPAGYTVNALAGSFWTEGEFIFVRRPGGIAKYHIEAGKAFWPMVSFEPEEATG